MIHYPRLDDVLAEYRRRFPDQAVLDRGQVESNMARPAAGYSDTEFYPEIVDKAAVLLHAFASTQPFEDGNKRMAVYVMHTFLLINGWDLTLGEIELYDITMDLACGDMPLEKVAGLLADHLVEMDLNDLS